MEHSWVTICNFSWFYQGNIVLTLYKLHMAFRQTKLNLIHLMNVVFNLFKSSYIEWLHNTKQLDNNLTDFFLLPFMHDRNSDMGTISR